MILDQLDDIGGAYAIGRNGRFTPRTAEIWDTGENNGGMIRLTLYSVQRGKTPPLVLHLSPAQMRRVAEALLQTCQAVERDGPRPVVCPGCGETGKETCECRKR